MPTILINPFNEAVSKPRQAAPRLATLAGKTIGLLDISKPGGSIFLDRIEQLLKEGFNVAQVIRVTKPTFTRPAPGEVLNRITQAGCHAVIEALAD